jgi:hypothetical protein
MFIVVKLKYFKFKLVNKCILYNPVIFNGKIVVSDFGDQFCDYCNFVTIGLLMMEVKDFRNV